MKEYISKIKNVLIKNYAPSGNAVPLHISQKIPGLFGKRKIDMKQFVFSIHFVLFTNETDGELFVTNSASITKNNFRPLISVTTTDDSITTTMQQKVKEDPEIKKVWEIIKTVI